MHSHSPNSIDRLAAAAWVLLASVACSGGNGATDGGACPGPSCMEDSGPGFPYGGCAATFSNDFQDFTFADAGCTTLTALPDSGYATDAGPDWLLQFQVFSSSVQEELQVTVDLGPYPSAGTYSQESTVTWSAVMANPTADICEFVSGAQAVPEESFSLSLTSVSNVANGSAQAHGTFSTLQYVEASAGSFCGTSDHEAVTIDF